MKIPVVKREIISSFLVEVEGPQGDPNWVDNYWTKLRVKNPVLAEYVGQVLKQFDNRAVYAALVMYRLIESQMEANNLEELFNEDA